MPGSQKLYTLFSIFPGCKILPNFEENINFPSQPIFAIRLAAHCDSPAHERLTWQRCGRLFYLRILLFVDIIVQFLPFKISPAHFKYQRLSLPPWPQVNMIQHVEAGGAASQRNAGNILYSNAGSPLVLTTRNLFSLVLALTVLRPSFSTV
jgi:hypothetical protein